MYEQIIQLWIDSIATKIFFLLLKPPLFFSMLRVVLLLLNIYLEDLLTKKSFLSYS